ncbi:MAG TPA: cytidine deaminase [Thermoanaerobaculia bacterium]|jgi:cytidine deaminase
MHTDEIEVQRRAAGGYLPADVVDKIVAAGTPIDQLLLSLVPVAQKLAIPPISNFFVGATLLGESGAIYFGANYEFAGQALAFTIHGEQAAVAMAMSFGERGIRKLAVSAAPCGLCRQFLNELTTASTLEVLVVNAQPTTLTALLPQAFGPADLGVTAALLSPQSHGLTIDADDDVALAALAAANASYAPYSSSFAGVAFRTTGGAIYAGALAENAAYNPTLGAMEAAVVNLVIRGGESYADITEAVLVETGSISQVNAARAVLGAISNVPLRVLPALTRG